MKIELKNVTKKYKNNIILEDVSVTFESSNIYLLIGENGSGKTTLLKLICGYINPSCGDIIFDDKKLNKDIEIPNSIGCLIENPSFIPNLSGYKNLKLLADIKKKINKEDIENTLKIVSLYEEKDKTYYKYSLGMKQKLGIAQAIMENPDIIILDEPFNAIDRQSKEKIINFLIEQKENGKIIIISTHLNDDLIKLLPTIYLVENKKVIKQ